MTEFDRFWAAYPRKVGKLAALREWQKQTPPIQDVMTALEWQTPQWNDPMYIPHPRTWLYQGRWMDEPVGRLQLATVPNCPHTPPCRNENACAHQQKYPNGFPMQIVKVAK